MSFPTIPLLLLPPPCLLLPPGTGDVADACVEAAALPCYCQLPAAASTATPAASLVARQNRLLLPNRHSR